MYPIEHLAFYSSTKSKQKNKKKKIYENRSTVTSINKINGLN